MSENVIIIWCKSSKVEISVGEWVDKGVLGIFRYRKEMGITYMFINAQRLTYPSSLAS